VLDGSPHASRGRGCFWRGFWHCSAFLSNTLQWWHTDTLTCWSIIDSCVKNRQYFRTCSVCYHIMVNKDVYEDFTD